MGQLEILEKLNKELEKDINNEAQVVYILSRIRKYLELKNQKSKYKYLNFYCNWALHAKLERTEPISDVLRGVSKLNEIGIRFLTFEHLKMDLKNFFRKNDIPEDILDKQWLKFRSLLRDIYSDTPLEFYPEGKKVLTISKPEKLLENDEFSVAFKITEIKN